MLCLSRKTGEKLIIRDDIEIVVVSVDRGVVRLGVTAPKDVPIMRSELVPHGGHPKHPTEPSKP